MKRLMAALPLAAVLLVACAQEGGPDRAAPQAQAAPDAPAADDAQALAADAVQEKPETPALVVSTVAGETYDLADHRGDWVIVNFWATWCSPCLKEMPELSELASSRAHIEVIGLAYEEIEPEAMQAFLEKHPVEYPIAILDVYDPPKDFDTPRGLPMTYLIGPDGRVARQFLGPVTGDEIEQAIAANGGPGAGDTAQDAAAPARGG